MEANNVPSLHRGDLRGGDFTVTYAEAGLFLFLIAPPGR